MRRNLILFLAIALFSGIQANVSSYCPSGGSCTNTFSVLPQFISPGEPILFEKVSAQTREIDLCFASTFGMIIFNRSGTYKIIWYGKVRSPFNIPWTLGFSLDNIIILGSIYGSSGCHSTFENVEGSLVLSINAGQVLRLVNASSYPIELIDSTHHSKTPIPSFGVCLCLFEPHYERN